MVSAVMKVVALFLSLALFSCVAAKDPVDLIKGGIISSDGDVVIRAIESSLDGNFIYACGSFSGEALFGRTAVRSAGRTSFFLANIDVTSNEVPVLFVDVTEGEGMSECVGLNRIGYHVYAFARFEGSSITVSDHTLQSTGSGGLVQLEIVSEDTNPDMLFVPLLSFNGEFFVEGANVNQDDAVFVGRMSGSAKNKHMSLQTDSMKGFVIYGDHHLRDRSFGTFLEDTADSRDRMPTCVTISEDSAIVVGGISTVVISDDVSSKMINESVSFVQTLKYDHHEKGIVEKSNMRMRGALISNLAVMWKSVPPTVVAAGTFSDRFGVQAEGHQHHYVYPAEAQGTADGMLVGIPIQTLRMEWLNTIGYAGSRVINLSVATSRVRQETSVDSTDMASQIFVVGAFTGQHMAAGMHVQENQQEDAGRPTLFIADAEESGQWRRLMALEDANGAAEFSSGLTVNNVETRAYMSAHAQVARGKPAETVQVEWVGDVSALKQQEDADKDASLLSIGEGQPADLSDDESGAITLGQMLLFLLVPVVVVVAFGSGLALLIYLVRRPSVAGDDYSVVPVA